MMQKKKAILILTVFLFSALQVRAQKKLKLSDAIQTALKHNKDIQVAKLEVKKARAAVSEAFGYALPTVDLTGNFSRFLAKPKMAFPDFRAMLNNAVYGVLFNEKLLPFDQNKFLPLETKLQAFVQRNNFSTNIQVSQILFNSAVFRGIGASQIYLNLSKEQLKSLVLKTTVKVKKAFYGVLLAKELNKITRERYRNAKENLTTIKQMRKQGLVSEFDEMQAEVRVENIKPILINMENVLANAKNGLKILLGLEQDEKIDVEGEMDFTTEILPAEEVLVEKVIDNNLDLKTLRIKRQVDEEFIAIDRSAYWPTLVAFGNFSYAGSADNWDFQNYHSITVGLNFSINLFQGMRAARKVEQDVIATKQTDKKISVFQSSLIMQVKQKLNELKRIQEQIKSMNRNVRLAQKAYEIARVRYKEGSGTQLEVKNAAVELNLAKTNRVKAIHDYLTAKADLDELTGNVNPDYLDFVKDYLK